jgi:hypothetical protein
MSTHFVCMTYFHKIVVSRIFDNPLPETDMRTTNILRKYVAHAYVFTMALQQVEIHQKIQLMLSQNCD